MEKLEKDDIDEEYMKDFLDLEVLEMDKGKLVWDFGSKRAKKLVVESHTFKIIRRKKNEVYRSMRTQLN